MRINSPGGSVFDGLAIHNALKRLDARVTVFVDGIAASIASVIAMAGDEVIMPENAMLMIHDPSGIVMGTASDMRSMAEALEKTKAGLVTAYREKSGLSDAEIEQIMANETWLTANEAVEKGFADRLEEPVKMAAYFDLSQYDNAPEQLIAKLPAQGEAHNEPNNVVDLMAIRSQVRGATLAYVNEIHEICNLAGVPDRALPFINKEMSAVAVRQALIKERADNDEALIINHRHGADLSRSTEESARPTINTQAIYAARNAQPGKGES
ncbi:putative protease/scaffold protein [Magnetofaba australis IT-1]|uniref:Putative protease/scaffold protein n=1 Tax=Magnetofaba australis IT-1 TaxID=1434232 RepID=A0A1Y2K6U5_9PROT|nr:putative protease/scaffold protein [Magnetofaba australis IT-1]